MAPICRLTGVVLALMVVLSLQAEAASFFNRSVSDYYVGARVGRYSGTKDPGKKIGYGLDLATKISKKAQFALNFEGALHPTRQNYQMFSASPGLELYPFAMAELRAHLGVALGGYYFSGPRNVASAGINLGLGVDIMVQNVRVGLASRYHLLFDSSTVPDFWNVMFRIGFEINGA